VRLPPLRQDEQIRSWSGDLWKGRTLMCLINEIEVVSGVPDQTPEAEHLTWTGECMETLKHCAYNQTRECFLGLDVEVADISPANMERTIGSLDLKSGEGLWIVPYREIPVVDTKAPLDLIYLNESCSVVDLVESFPLIRGSLVDSKVASILALPAHSIYLSQTQNGDQMLICRAEEMESGLERLTHSIPVAGIAQTAVPTRETTLWQGDLGPMKSKNSASKANSAPQTQEGGAEVPSVKPGKNNTRQPKSWLERWMTTDPRKASRMPAPGLAAYYWNGAAPASHGVKDISSTGLYLETEERWYPGTLVLVTLQEGNSKESNARNSISVYSKVVRWGEDGVGLQYILQDDQASVCGQNSAVIGIDKKQLELFLQRLRERGIV
jgi:hypothetical protein